MQRPIEFFKPKKRAWESYSSFERERKENNRTVKKVERKKISVADWKVVRKDKGVGKSDKRKKHENWRIKY